MKKVVRKILLGLVIVILIAAGAIGFLYFSGRNTLNLGKNTVLL